MKHLVVRRHSFTTKGAARGTGSALSQEGVAAARDAGSRLEGIAYVMTGPLPRHIETAVAMGFAVDEVIDWPSGYVAGEVEHHDQWTWSQPYLRYAELLATRSVLGSVVTAHVEHWLRALSLIDDHASALIISSGGSIEPVLVAVMPDSAHESWGDALRHLEGATLTHDGTAFVDIEFHRSQI